MDTVSNRHIHGQGTREAAWRPWLEAAGIEVLDVADLVPSPGRLLVVAPHPDDEVLGAGGLLAAAHAAGSEVEVVLATDGGASHPGSTRWSADMLMQTRPLETRAALTLLGLPEAKVRRLGLPDGEIEGREQQLAALLGSVVRAGDTVVTTWRLDGHPDHEAVARACTACAAEAGARLLEMPIWGWHWMRPGQSDLPWDRACRISLSPEIERRKRLAVQAYRSQLEPDPTIPQDAVVPHWALERLLRAYEVFIR